MLVEISLVVSLPLEATAHNGRLLVVVLSLEAPVAILRSAQLQQSLPIISFDFVEAIEFNFLTANILCSNQQIIISICNLYLISLCISFTLRNNLRGNNV